MAFCLASLLKWSWWQQLNSTSSSENVFTGFDVNFALTTTTSSSTTFITLKKLPDPSPLPYSVEVCHTFVKKYITFYCS